MAELGEFELNADRRTLGVEVEMLEYEYIDKCNDPEKLRAIVEVLKSGKEGYYPDVSEGCYGGVRWTLSPLFPSLTSVPPSLPVSVDVSYKKKLNKNGFQFCQTKIAIVS